MGSTVAQSYMRKEPVTMKNTRFVGLDVHAATIAVAVAEAGGEVGSLGTIPNEPDAVRRLMKRLGPAEQLRVCYEAGPCGYTLYWHLVRLGVACQVIAPTLVPVKAGDRVKTDRRDAERLARGLRSGDLTPVWVPDAAHEALRDLVRAREAAKKDQLRARHRLQKFLLRHGQRPPAGTTAWTDTYHRWITTLRFEQPAQDATRLDYLTEVDHAQARIVRLDQALAEAVQTAPASMRAVIAALQTLRGIAQVAAVTIVAEVGDFSRFTHPRQLVAYFGLAPGEHSSGSSVRPRGITKAGNATARSILCEAAWNYRTTPKVGQWMKQHRPEVPQEIIDIAWKAQLRLHKTYKRLTSRGKRTVVATAAVARELLCFMWSIGRALPANA